MIYDKACGGGVITINSIGVAAMRPGPGALWRAQMRIIVALGGTALARRGEALDAEVQRRNIAHAIGAAQQAAISSSAWKVVMPNCFSFARMCRIGDDGVMG